MSLLVLVYPVCISNSTTYDICNTSSTLLICSIEFDEHLCCLLFICRSTWDSRCPFKILSFDGPVNVETRSIGVTKADDRFALRMTRTRTWLYLYMKSRI